MQISAMYLLFLGNGLCSLDSFQPKQIRLLARHYLLFTIDPCIAIHALTYDDASLVVSRCIVTPLCLTTFGGSYNCHKSENKIIALQLTHK